MRADVIERADLIRRKSSASPAAIAIGNQQIALGNSDRDAMLTPHSHDLGSAEVSSARTLLAVRRAGRAADQRGARRARSGSARCAVRPAAAAVLDHAG